MTPKERAAMQQALEALENAYENGFLTGIAGLKTIDTITVMREALAEQTEQEPVGYFAYDEEHDIWEELTGPNAPGATPLYAAPVRTKDLTDEEIFKTNKTELPDCQDLVDFARAVISADREKNK